MKRLRKLWRETFRPWWYDYEWPVIGLIAVAVVVLGCIGFRLKFIEENLMAGPNGQKPIEFLDLVFRSFQLFVLQISADPPMPWQLNLARLLAPLVAAYTALQALGERFAGEVRSPPTPRTWSSLAWDAWAKACWSTPPPNGTPSGPSPNASSASP